MRHIICFVILLISILISIAVESRGEDMKTCKAVCLDTISVDECVKEEIAYWEKEQIKRREIIKSCKELIRNSYKYCLEECLNDKSDTRRPER